MSGPRTAGSSQRRSRPLWAGLVGLVAVGTVAAVGFSRNGDLGIDSDEAEEPTAFATEGTRWGSDYFPNTRLVTHEGKEVRFFDDLIKDKVVVINFIYTSCPDSCPLETARLAQLETILGDRVGDDVFMYSISIDPKVDTPDVLAAYRDRYDAGPGWTFLTGDEDEIVELRRKLGLYIPEIQNDDSNNHNLSLIIGNQATGQWMKRSPFENPHVLATHVGSWLHNWKLPAKEQNDYSDAPKLRDVSDGERLFRTRCAACHTIGGEVVGGSVATDKTGVGPDLLDVTRHRKPEWLARWIAEPDKMLAEKDPLAMELFAQYNNVPMPNMRLTRTDVSDIIGFLQAETSRLRRLQAAKRAGELRGNAPAFREQRLGSLSISGAWIREPHAEANVAAGYLTLRNEADDSAEVVSAKSPAFGRVELHEMTMVDGRMSMRALDGLPVPANGQVRLKTGGKHLMLITPHKPITHGTNVEITLELRSGESWTVELPVIASQRPRIAASG